MTTRKYLMPVVVQLIPLWSFRQNVIGIERVNESECAIVCAKN